MNEIVVERMKSAVGAAHVVPDGERVQARPGSAAEIADLLRVARELDLHIGAGPTTSAPIAIDFARMRSILHLDETSLLCTVQAGVTAEALEAQLGARGLTIGPLPAASRGRTVGALLAAPRPSEASPRVGRFAAACAGVGAVLPDGTEISTRVAPRKATGPDLMHALVGARGTLGIITSATLRLMRRGEHHEEAAWELATVEAALDSARAILVRGGRPLDLAVATAPAPTLSIAVEGPAPLVEAERQLAARVVGERGGRAVPHTPPPLTSAPPWEKALPMASLVVAEGGAPSLRVVGWHSAGAALVDAARPAARPDAPHPLVAALKRRLDPDGRLPAWPGS
jgi:FAD/FMN-containing dehydrogenase